MYDCLQILSEWQSSLVDLTERVVYRLFTLMFSKYIVHLANRKGTVLRQGDCLITAGYLSVDGVCYSKQFQITFAAKTLPVIFVLKNILKYY